MYKRAVLERGGCPREVAMQSDTSTVTHAAHRRTGQAEHAAELYSGSAETGTPSSLHQK